MGYVAFPKVLTPCEMYNNLVQDLKLGHWIHFLLRWPLLHERLEIKLYNCVQTNNYHQGDIISWKHKIINFRREYLKPYNCVEIICIK